MDDLVGFVCHGLLYKLPWKRSVSKALFLHKKGEPVRYMENFKAFKEKWPSHVQQSWADVCLGHKITAALKDGESLPTMQVRALEAWKFEV